MALFGAPWPSANMPCARAFQRARSNPHNETRNRGASPRRRCLADSRRADFWRRDRRRNRFRPGRYTGIGIPSEWRSAWRHPSLPAASCARSPRRASSSRDVDEIAVPATVQAVLAARIDRLAAEAKSMLNAAAVIGSQFDVDTLKALRPETASAQPAELVSAESIDQTEIRSAATLLLPPPTGTHRGLRIAVERHSRASPQQARGRR